MTEAQEHNLEEVLSRDRGLPKTSGTTSPQAVSPGGYYGQQYVPRPTYRPPVVQAYARSYGNSAYIPLGAPPSSMIYRGGSPYAPVSPITNSFANLLHPPGGMPGYGGGMPAPSAVSGTYAPGSTPYMAAGAGPNVPVEQGGSNPFNLSPFGMLHYMWDDTTYTSPTNPVALYQVQNDLQIAKQQSQLAQSAAARAKYLTDPAARRQASQQAQYYAQQAQLAAERARSESEAGSLDPAQLATAASSEADQAAAAAKNAASFAAGGY